MEQQTRIIEELIKEFEMVLIQEEVKILLMKMEECISKQKEETRAQKVHTFNRDKPDYEYGSFYIFAHKYDTLRAKETLNIMGRSDATPSNTDVSSDPGSAADKALRHKLNFQGEIKLMQMAIHPTICQMPRTRLQWHKTRKRKRKICQEVDEYSALQVDFPVNGRVVIFPRQY
ncbi:hypothetical protein NDU88_007592 [Pleurodeles waltl]|uniref:Uncharacterized protein n=1 Tax=Pleurodeles waltl TaxID=8319 RepID=A0AAV7U452_PLEWA|nr:hypothetical protein NDU88_007592 [Pleurodeles waltl]